MKFNKKILFFTFIYFVVRYFSYYYAPETPLHGQNLLNSIVAEFITISVIYLLCKNNPWGWYIVALEMVLGGSGAYFGIMSISLRSLLLIASLAIFFGQKISKKEIHSLYRETKTITKIFALLFAVVFLAVLRGRYYWHSPSAVLSDMIPYLFLLYYYPLRELIKNKEFKDICFTAICAAVIGNAIFMAFSLFGFSSGMFVLQDYYYHWFRDVASGKITDLGMGYFRLVLNEHLLLIPMLLYFIYKIIREKAISVLNISIAVLLLFILSINLSRIYLLALAVGLLFFFTKSAWKRWLVICASTAVAFMLVFTCTHLIATRGQSLGWEVFGLRIQSIVQPQIEDSSLSRMLLLPKIWEKIKTHTILGNGLGDTVTVYSPVLEQKISTPHFDWGYFELWDELGMLGIVIWALLIVYIFRGLYQAKEHDNIYFISALASIIIMNITSPALFHVMGLLFIAITATSFQKINSN